MEEYRAGQHYTRARNYAVFGPGFPASQPEAAMVARRGDTMYLGQGLAYDFRTYLAFL